ncbi:glycoside hydrolase family 172 protein [Rhizobium phaseoli]|uniref:glycoside hydrolase family 172 protein n=1 Tax=Rhizobium phaseoli TaxID=396 RepID=UPI0007E99A1E|nr:glycoside hydrolase family 172 protein [Rhizobium phaseoli]
MTTSNPGHSMLADLARVKDARTGRLSSWDQDGKNQDYWLIPANSTVRLAEIEGPGCITHIWLTQFCRRVLGAGLIDPTAGNYVAPVFEIHNALGLNWEVADPHYYRKVLLKIYWDGQETPSVLVPLGDFFCTGHSMPGNFSSLPISVSCKPEERYRFGGSAAFNSYFQMPFGERAIVEIENQNDVPYGQYFYIDFERYEAPLADDIAYFHASWRRENPCGGWGPNLQTNSPETNIPNLDGKENYVILETEGRGQYVGCNLSVAHFQGSWWGEGDEMIFVDEDSWPPSIHGTGTEDYFNHAWGMQNNAFLMNGSVIHESIVPGYQVSYRFHLTDPVRFKNRLRVTIEHGHANHLSDDWASTAYWYQTLPSPKLTILPVEQRLPTPPGDRVPERVSRERLTAEQAAQIDAADQRFRAYSELRDVEIEKKLETTRRRSAANVSTR